MPEGQNQCVVVDDHDQHSKANFNNFCTQEIISCPKANEGVPTRLEEASGQTASPMRRWIDILNLISSGESSFVLVIKLFRNAFKDSVWGIPVYDSVCTQRCDDDDVATMAAEYTNYSLPFDLMEILFHSASRFHAPFFPVDTEMLTHTYQQSLIRTSLPFDIMVILFHAASMFHARFFPVDMETSTTIYGCRYHYSVLLVNLPSAVILYPISPGDIDVLMLLFEK
ncbi:hypothetical protein KP509_22G051400 [Ceratopteris richardii]|uniref:Uncharacterized protein n=1 Tax=Ceratopteris richardii TaxID=49495 RepID=A0A8T2S516_CERRI|nr:hypothetical protein KP509_22G051400 [Ceratopteris richardii]